MHRKWALFLVMMGLIFVSSGVTGFATLGQPNDMCSSDSDCQYAVCCELAGEDFGVCAQASQCDNIYEESIPTGRTAALAAEVPEKVERSYVALTLGIILLVFVLVIAYVEWHQEKLHPGHHSRKTRRKRRSKK